MNANNSVESPLKPPVEGDFRSLIFESSPLAMVVMEGDSFRFIDCNPRAAAIYGYQSKEELLGRTPCDVSAARQYDAMPSMEKWAEYVKQALKNDSVVFEWLHQRADGTYWDGQVRLLNLSIPDKQKFLYFSLVDITGRRHEEQLKRLLHDLIIGLNSSNDLHHGLKQVLQSALSFEGVDCGAVYVRDVRSDSLRMVASDGLSPEYAAEINCIAIDSPFAHIAVRGEVSCGTYAGQNTQSGGIHVQEGLRGFIQVPIRFNDALIALLVLSSRKTDYIPLATRQAVERIASQTSSTLKRLHTEEILRENESIFQCFMDNSPIYVFIKDQDLKTIRLSSNYRQMLGRPVQDLLGKTPQELFPSALAESICRDDQSALLGGKVIAVDEEFAGRQYNTVKFPIDIAGKPRYLAGYTIDVTEKRRSEALLQNAHKLDALGVLAGGIAHDFNNLLSGLFGNMELALIETSKSAGDAYIERALAAMGRARDLTRQLLTFAKGGAPVKKVDALMPFLQNAVQFALSGADVDFHLDAAPDLWSCSYDRNQMGQAINNIVINAVQAMPAGGRIEILARNVTLAAGQHTVLPAGEYACITISDSGLGIPPEDMHKIFDPFFTTKPSGHGLGLATCYSIMKRHGGSIDVESKPGKGTRFHLYLPAAAGPLVETPSSFQAQHRGEGIFIVMDDEDLVRRLLTRMLELFGYTVVAFKNGSEVLEYYSGILQREASVAGMIFDLTIPGAMGGREAIQEIRKLDSLVPVFVVSGYAADPAIALPQQYGFTGSIAKPFALKELSELLNLCMPSTVH